MTGEPIVILTGGALDPHPKVLFPDGVVVEVPESEERQRARHAYGAALHADVDAMIHPSRPD